MVERKEPPGFYMDGSRISGALSVDLANPLGESFTNARRLLVDAHSVCVVPDKVVEGVQPDLLTTLSSDDFPPIPPVSGPKNLTESGVFLPPLPESTFQK